MAVDKARLTHEFAQRFGPGPRLFRAPGRVNLIGEHTDYNDGYVFPVAMDREVCFAVRRRDDRTVRAHALDLGKSETFSLDELEWTPGGYWTNYIKAMAGALQDAGYACHGFDAVIAGDVPIGGGVSSSSAFTVAAATAFEGLADWSIDDKDLIKLTQIAENSATGLRGGIMDQFTARLAKAGHALRIDCRSLAYELVPMPEMTIVVADSRKPRSLADTAYNERRGQCEAGAAVIAKTYPEVKALRDVTPAMLAEHQDRLDEVIYRRCRHVVTEDQRVLECVDILKAGDLPALGERINASHRSLRDDYEVSCKELDTIAELAWETDGVYGARMVGAGFGGCVIAVCEAAAVPALKERIETEYPRRCNLQPDVYATKAGDGAGEVE